MTMCLWFHLSPSLCIHSFAIHLTILSYLCQTQCCLLAIDENCIHGIFCRATVPPQSWPSLLRILFVMLLLGGWSSYTPRRHSRFGCLHLFAAIFIYFATINECPHAARTTDDKGNYSRRKSSLSSGPFCCFAVDTKNIDTLSVSEESLFSTSRRQSFALRKYRRFIHNKWYSVSTINTTPNSSSQPNTALFFSLSSTVLSILQHPIPTHNQRPQHNRHPHQPRRSLTSISPLILCHSLRP
jgi:hypothetical protein